MLKASHRRIREDGGENDQKRALSYPEDAKDGVPKAATATAASGGRRPPPPPPNPNASTYTPPPRDGGNDPGSRSKSLVRRQGPVPKGSDLVRKAGTKGEEGMGEQARKNGGPAWSPLDAAVRPLQAFATLIQEQVGTLGFLIPREESL